MLERGQLCADITELIQTTHRMSITNDRATAPLSRMFGLRTVATYIYAHADPSIPTSMDSDGHVNHVARKLLASKIPPATVRCVEGVWSHLLPAVVLPRQRRISMLPGTACRKVSYMHLHDYRSPQQLLVSHCAAAAIPLPDAYAGRFGTCQASMSGVTC